MYNAQYGEHLIQLTRFAFVNVFLVREADGFTLVDASMSGSAAAILKAAEHFGAPIQRIVLTHAHIDHVGSLDALHEQLPNAEIAISARDAPFLKGDMQLLPDEPQTPLRGGFPPVNVVPDRLLQHGDRIGSLEVVASPGHTPGHIAFFDVRDRSLIAGDAFSRRAGISTGGTMRLLFPFPAMATWNKPTALQSAETLLALNPSRLAVGHGRTLENPASEMRYAIEVARRRVGIDENDV